MIMKEKACSLQQIDFKSLPLDLQKRGEPLSVHRSRCEKLTDDVSQPINADLRRIAKNVDVLGSSFRPKDYIAFGLWLLVAGSVALGLPFLISLSKAVVLIALMAGASTTCLGVLNISRGWRVRGSMQQAVSRSRTTKLFPTYLVYSDGLAVVEGDVFKFLSWVDVRELTHSRANKSQCLTLVDWDRTRIILDPGVADDEDLHSAIYEAVTAVQLPRVMERIETGKTVSFGSLGISKTCLRFKGESIHWDQIRDLEIQGGQLDRRLTIHCNEEPLPWCRLDLNDMPNESTFREVIRQTAPLKLHS